MIKFSFDVIPAYANDGINDGIRVTAQSPYCKQPIVREVFPKLGVINEEMLKVMVDYFIPRFEDRFRETIAEHIANDMIGGYAPSSTQAMRSRLSSPSPLSRTRHKTAANLPRAGRKT